MKSLSDKWDKLQSTYAKLTKMRNQTGGGTRDDGAKFIWYNAIDEILSLTTKANGISGGMNQDVPVPGRGTSDTLVDLLEGHEEGEEPSLPPPSSIGNEHESTGSSPRTSAANLIGCSGNGTSSKPTKRAKIDHNLMDALDRLTDFSVKIEKL